MYSMYKYGIILFFLAQYGIGSAVENLLSVPTALQCEQKSYTIGNRIERDSYIRACAMTVAASYTVYLAWHWLSGERRVPVVNTPVVAPEGTQSTGSLFAGWAYWLFDSSKFLAKLCAQQLVANWVLSRCMQDSSLRAFINKNITYKLDEAAIERCLKTLADAPDEVERKRLQTLICTHLQLLINKNALLMAYMLYYVRDEAPCQNGAIITSYVALTLPAIEREVARFNATVGDDFIASVTEARKSLLELMTSSIRYAKSALPLDGDAVVWQ